MPVSITEKSTSLVRTFTVSIIIIFVCLALLYVDTTYNYQPTLGSYDTSMRISTVFSLLGSLLVIGEIIACIRLLQLTRKNRTTAFSKGVFAYAIFLLAAIVLSPFILIYAFFHFFTGSAIAPPLQ